MDFLSLSPQISIWPLLIPESDHFCISNSSSFSIEFWRKGTTRQLNLFLTKQRKGTPHQYNLFITFEIEAFHICWITREDFSVPTGCVEVIKASRLVPLHPSQYPLTGFTVQGNYHSDRCLPMSVRFACKIFWKKNSNCLKYIMSTHYKADVGFLLTFISQTIQ